MSDTAEHALSKVPWPPIVFACAVAASVILGYALPLPWLPSPLSDLLLALGWLLVAATVFMDFSALRSLRRAKTAINPTRPAEHLVTTGAYAFSRNPLYLGNTVLMIAVGFITGIVWFLVMGIVAAFLTQKLAIEPEERHLAARFGKRYRDYQKKARRWF